MILTEEFAGLARKIDFYLTTGGSTFPCFQITYNPGQKSLAHVGENHTFISFYLKQCTYTPSLFSKHDVQTPLSPTQCCGRDLAFAQIMCNIEWGERESISLKPGGIPSLCLHI